MRDWFYWTFRRDYVGLRVGRLYLVVRNLRYNRPLFSERNRIRCRYITIGNWRLLARWNSPAIRKSS